MSHRIGIIKEWVDIQITQPNQKVKGAMEVDKLAGHILGISISANLEDKLYYRGSQRITINEMEIFPEGYESKMLMQGLNVPVNQRIIRLGQKIEPGNRKVEIEFQDTEAQSAKFAPYRVRLYVYSQLKTNS